MTNFEKIKQMNVDELSILLTRMIILTGNTFMKMLNIPIVSLPDEAILEGVTKSKEWLESEVKE